MSNTAIETAAPDYTTIKTKQNAAWSSGDYAIVGTTLQIVGENLAEALDVRSDQKVLDVAAGNGNFTLAAARRWAKVTSTDYVEGLLARSEECADAERLDVAYQVADAEDLPFAEATYDTVASTFGVMFTPNQEKAASEMLRVCSSGGKIGLANWTPNGFIGSLFKVIGRYVPPPAGVRSPALWGTSAHIEALFGEGVQDIRIVEKTFAFRYRSPAHWLNIFRDYYGPVHKAYAALDADKQEALSQDLIGLIDSCNVAKDGTMVVPADYIEVVLTRW
ncbi:MAG: methyltransferase domain-containing protein [Alphaproteobacteria bacterium]|nr:methyltransferase domain-containing protein [Alphaproteobacteria bacterium]